MHVGGSLMVIARTSKICVILRMLFRGKAVFVQRRGSESAMARTFLSRHARRSFGNDLGLERPPRHGPGRRLLHCTNWQKSVALSWQSPAHHTLVDSEFLAVISAVRFVTVLLREACVGELRQGIPVDSDMLKVAARPCGRQPTRLEGDNCDLEKCHPSRDRDE